MRLLVDGQNLCRICIGRAISLNVEGCVHRGGPLKGERLYRLRSGWVWGWEVELGPSTNDTTVSTTRNVQRDKKYHTEMAEAMSAYFPALFAGWG